MTIAEKSDLGYMAMIEGNKRPDNAEYDDEGLKKVIRKLYNFIQSFPDPIKWLYDKAAMYDNNMSQSVWFKEIFLSVHKENILKHHGEFWDKLIKEMIGIVSNIGERCGSTYVYAPTV